MTTTGDDQAHHDIITCNHIVAETFSSFDDSSSDECQLIVDGGRIQSGCPFQVTISLLLVSVETDRESNACIWKHGSHFLEWKPRWSRRLRRRCHRVDSDVFRRTLRKRTSLTARNNVRPLAETKTEKTNFVFSGYGLVFWGTLGFGKRIRFLLGPGYEFVFLTDRLHSRSRVARFSPTKNEIRFPKNNMENDPFFVGENRATRLRELSRSVRKTNSHPGPDEKTSSFSKSYGWVISDYTQRTIRKN